MKKSGFTPSPDTPLATFNIFFGSGVRTGNFDEKSFCCKKSLTSKKAGQEAFCKEIKLDGWAIKQLSINLFPPCPKDLTLFPVQGGSPAGFMASHSEPG
jgi:hypothetical protein